MGSFCRLRRIHDSGPKETNGSRDPADGTGGDGFDGAHQRVDVDGYDFKPHGYIGKFVEDRDGDAIPGHYSAEVGTYNPSVGSMAQAPPSLVERATRRKRQAGNRSTATA